MFFLKLLNSLRFWSQDIWHCRCLQIYTWIYICMKEGCFLFNAVSLQVLVMSIQSFSWTLENKQLWSKSPSAANGWSDRNLNYARIHSNKIFRKWENHQGMKKEAFFHLYYVVRLFWTWAKSTSQWCWYKLTETTFTHSETLTCISVTESRAWHIPQ